MNDRAAPHTLVSSPTATTRVRTNMSTTGNRTTESATPKAGRFPPSSVRVPTIVPGAWIGTQRAIGRASTGPAMMTVGTATISPSPSVRPRSAFSASMAMSGPGCGSPAREAPRAPRGQGYPPG